MRTLTAPYALFSYMRAQRWTERHICGPGMVMCKIGDKCCLPETLFSWGFCVSDQPLYSAFLEKSPGKAAGALDCFC